MKSNNKRNTGKIIINTKNYSIKVKKHPEYCDILPAIIQIFSRCPKDYPGINDIKQIFFNLSENLGNDYTIKDITKGLVLSENNKESIEDFAKRIENYNNAAIDNALEELNDEIIEINQKRFYLMKVLEKRRIYEEL